MGTLGSLLDGFIFLLQPEYLLYALLGALLGTIVGVLPGLGPSATIALLIPITLVIGDPAGATIMFAGIFYGAMYGGSTTAILLNMPGEGASVVTALDGHEMTRAGRAGAALVTAAIGSFVAGTLATFGLVLLARPTMDVALEFGPPELFALMVLALSLVGGLGGSPAAAALSTTLGVAVGTVGIELVSGQSRFTFGIVALYDGVAFVLVAIALFAVSEAMLILGNDSARSNRIVPVGKLYMTRDEWRRSGPAWLRGSVIGFFTGMLPGAGATIASFLSYGAERGLSKERRKFGTGMVEGVAGPEAANNGSAGGSMVPMLLLGIPGSAATAIILGGIQGFGIETGPLLMVEEPDLVWGLIASFYVANIALLVLNLPLVRLWVSLLKVPAHLLFPMILMLCVVGVYSVNRSMVDLYLLVILGVIGFLMRRVGIPLAPFILGLILGPMLEAELGRALVISSGDWSILIDSPIAVGIYSLIVFVLVLVALFRRVRRSRGRATLPASRM